MPLSFVIIAFISCFAGYTLTPTSITKQRFFLLLNFLNVLILAAGVFLVYTKRYEPFWITYTSMAIGLLSAIFYAHVKFDNLSNQKYIHPQLY